MSQLSERVADVTGSGHGVGRVGEPEDIAAAIAMHFLVSDDPAWITSVVLPVDGGLTGSRPIVPE